MESINFVITKIIRYRYSHLNVQQLLISVLKNVNVTVIQFKNELLLSILGDVLLNSIFKFIACFSDLVKVVFPFVYSFNFHFELHEGKIKCIVTGTALQMTL